MPSNISTPRKNLSAKVTSVSFLFPGRTRRRWERVCFRPRMLELSYDRRCRNYVMFNFVMDGPRRALSKRLSAICTVLLWSKCSFATCSIAVGRILTEGVIGPWGIRDWFEFCLFCRMILLRGWLFYDSKFAPLFLET